MKSKQLHSARKFIVANRRIILLIFIFLINLLLVSPSLMPDISKINPDDEAKYVDSGWRLLKGDVRDLAWGPLVAVVYAPVHLFVGSSSDWFLLEVWAGRFFLFSFMWWSTIALSLSIKVRAVPYITACILFVSSPYLIIVQNQSDALFVGFSMLGLAQLFNFIRNREVRHIGLASLFVGLGVLARIETIFLIITLSLFGLIIGRKYLPAFKIVIAAILPALSVVVFYFLVSILLTGRINLGVSNKSYDSFEVNQSVLTGGDLELARQESRRLFGTQEENNNSILMAISKNPLAFGRRILANAMNVPSDYLIFFGKRLGFVLLVFAIFGGLMLVRHGRALDLFILIFWPLHVMIALGFLSLHIIPQSSYLPILLGAIGIVSVFGLETSERERVAFFLFVMMLIAGSLIFAKPAFLYGLLLLAFVLCFFWLIRQGQPKAPQVNQAALFLMFAVGLVLREPFSFPNYTPIGESNEELAIHYLSANLQVQSPILSPSPLWPTATKMAYISYSDIPTEISSIEMLYSWLKGKNISAVYLNSDHHGRNDIYDLFESGFEPYFLLEFSTTDQAVRIYLVK